MWKTWLHSPQTAYLSQPPTGGLKRVGHALSGQSSPGILHEGQQPSYGTRQIPHTSPSPSSSASAAPVSQRHWAIACQFFTCTFMTR